MFLHGIILVMWTGRGEALRSLPYRDSVLTWLLRDALSGRNHTTMLVSLILNASMGGTDTEELLLLDIKLSIRPHSRLSLLSNIFFIVCVGHALSCTHMPWRVTEHSKIRWKTLPSDTERQSVQRQREQSRLLLCDVIDIQRRHSTQTATTAGTISG